MKSITKNCIGDYECTFDNHEYPLFTISKTVDRFGKATYKILKCYVEYGGNFDTYFQYSEDLFLWDQNPTFESPFQALRYLIKYHERII